jgi:signal transduction histidine kinase
VVREEEFHSLAVVPLRSRDQVRGTLFALTRGHREFTKQDIQLLESIGHQVGAAIENAGLYESTKNQVAQLTALHDTAKAVASTLELKSLLNLIIQEAITLLRADGGFINLVDWDRRVDEVVAVAGIAPPVVGERISLEGSLSGWVTLHNQATISNEIQKDDRIVQSFRAWVIEENIQSAAAAPMIVRDQVRGTLLIIGQKEGKERFVQSDLDLLVAFANQAAIAIENARLYEQSKELAVLEERSRLARELHDAVTQTLFSASLVAEALPAIWEKDHQEGRGLLQELRSLSRGALAEMRMLLLELRPAALQETSLADLLRQLGEAASGRTGIPVSVQVDGQGKLPPDVHIAFYRITQEALNNVVKHARARQATVVLCYGDEDQIATSTKGKRAEDVRLSQTVLLSIRDDGRGFDTTQIAHDRLGLGIMQERAQAIGAILTIESQPGQGTQVTALWEQEGQQEAK